MTKLLQFDVNPNNPHPEATPVMTDLLQDMALNWGELQSDRWEAVDVHVIDNFESPAGLTDFIHAGTFRMVSSRFAEVLRNHNCKCEYLPLIVHYQGEVLADQYFALNALHVVQEAIDLDQSKIGYYDAEFHSAEDIEKLVLKADALGDAPLCYLSEMSHYAVSDALAQAIEAAGLVGIELMEPSKFSNY
jgi:hypothetical protein